MSKLRIAIIGAGGAARQTAWLIQEINRVEPCYQSLGYIVSDLTQLSQYDSRAEVLGDYCWLDAHQREVDALAIGIGTPAARLKVAAELKTLLPMIEWPVLAHPTAYYDQQSCTIGQGVIIYPGVIGTVNLIIEPFVMLNASCTIGHDARIKKGSVVNPAANISGGVNIGEGVLVGTGAQVLQYLNIGDLATIGAGAVVTKDVAAGETVVGVPAKPIKKMFQQSA